MAWMPLGASNTAPALPPQSSPGSSRGSRCGMARARLTRRTAAGARLNGGSPASPSVHFTSSRLLLLPLSCRSTSPLVREGAQCAPALRNLCSATSPAQTRAMHYAFTPGGCKGDPGNLTDALQDIANFQLTRGPFAWLGHGWLGCSRDYEVPEQFNWDFGEVSSGGGRGLRCAARIFVRPLCSPRSSATRRRPTAASSHATGPRPPCSLTATRGRPPSPSSKGESLPWPGLKVQEKRKGSVPVVEVPWVSLIVYPCTHSQNIGCILRLGCQLLH